MSGDLACLSIAESARLIGEGAVSPVDLVRASIERIEKVDHLVHAFITLTADRALAEARQAETEIRQGRHRGPLHGIPIGLKDVYYTAGVRTTGHSKIAQDFVPDADAGAYARLKEAGAILLGKLATHEFAHGGPSFDLPWPPARNPWNTAHFSGGSSSGSAVAVATGMVKGALGTDTGGSIRTPSGLCGVAGLKPTYGLVSRAGVFPNSFSLDHCGPMGWTVADCAYLLSAIAGHDPQDPSSVARPPVDYLTSLSQGIRGLRVGVVRHFYEDDFPAPPAVRAAMEELLAVLSSLGAQLEDVKLRPLEDYAACKMTIQLAEIYAAYEPELQHRLEDFGANFRYRVLPGALIRAVDYVQAQRTRRIFSRELDETFRDFDLLVTSGMYGPAPTFEDVERSSKFEKPSITVPFNVTGHPALSVCSGFSATGLPLALQIVGPAFGEETVLRAGHAYETATAWRDCRPQPMPPSELSRTASS